MLLREIDVLVIDLPIANAVQEPLDAGADHPLGVFEIEDVSDHAQVVLMCLIGRRLIDVARHLLLRAVAVVDPQLHEIGLVRREIADGLSSFFRRRHGIRHVVPRRIGGSRAGPRQAATNRPNDCRVRNPLVPQLVRQIARVGTGADRRGDTVVRVALKMIDVVLAREVGLRQFSRGGIEESEMAVRVDDGRHHGLSGEIDPHCAGGHLNRAFPADRGERVVGDDERRVLDRGAAVSRDESRALEHRDACRRSDLRGDLGGRCDEQHRARGKSGER